MIRPVETARLRLRPLAADDLDHMVELDADPEVRRHVDQPEAPTREAVERTMPRRLARFGAGDEPVFWAAESKEDGAFLGWFHLRPVPEHAGWLDLGYRLRREAWGRGYATEGAAALVERAFTRLGAERVVAHALEANAASRRVLEKAGLRPAEAYLHRGELPARAYALPRAEYDPTALPWPAAAEDLCERWRERPSEAD